MRLSSKVALISGGGTGIGAATARRFVAEGAKVVITGRRREPIEALAAEIGGVAVAGDTCDPTHTAAAVAAALSNFGHLDIVVASAGTGFSGSAHDVTDEQWRQTLDTNLTGAMVLVRSSLQPMLEAGRGAIVLVSSSAALVGGPGMYAYDTSKAGLIALSRSISVEYGPRGIRSNVLCPGWIVTPMADGAMDVLTAALGCTRQRAYQLVTQHVPLRRAAVADEMASCCLFLASDESSYVSGATLVADGGGVGVDITSLALALKSSRAK